MQATIRPALPWRDFEVKFLVDMMVRHDGRVALCVDTRCLRVIKLLKSLALLPNRSHVQQAKSGRETHWGAQTGSSAAQDPAHNTDGVVTLNVTPQTRHQPFRRFTRPKSKHDVQRSCCRHCRGTMVTSVCGAGMRPPATCMDHLSHDMFRDIESPYKHSTITEGPKTLPLETPDQHTRASVSRKMPVLALPTLATKPRDSFVPLFSASSPRPASPIAADRH